MWLVKHRCSQLQEWPPWAKWDRMFHMVSMVTHVIFTFGGSWRTICVCASAATITTWPKIQDLRSYNVDYSRYTHQITGRTRLSTGCEPCNQCAVLTLNLVEKTVYIHFLRSFIIVSQLVKVMEILKNSDVHIKTTCNILWKNASLFLLWFCLFSPRCILNPLFTSMNLNIFISNHFHTWFLLTYFF